MTPAHIFRPRGGGRFVLLCDHASNHIPAVLGDLGVPESALTRHIAWDIGTAQVTETLSELLDAPAVLCGTSRLVIDCNRQLDDPALIPIVSDGTPVPGNVGLSDEARSFRIERWFRPYHDAIETVLLERMSREAESILIAIHSMAPVLDGRSRPWQIAVSSHEDHRLSNQLLIALRSRGDLIVGDNEPYCIDPAIDYSIPFHALSRGLLHAQIEFRQDEIADTAAGQRWATRFAEALISAVRQLPS